MEIAKQLSKRLYQHSFIRYVVIGGTTFAIDFGVLVLLHGVLDVNVLFAATASYWLSIAFNFLANRFWTFGSTETHIAKHAVLYGALLACNYLFTIGFIAGATHLGMHYTIAKVLAVAIQMAWTYTLYKRVIFR